MHKTWIVPAAGRAGWAIGIGAWCMYLLLLRGPLYLLDFHVHVAGAWDLLDGSLYRSELIHPGILPVDRFNYPPLAAAIAVPFAWLPDELGGTLWVALNIIAMAGACILTARLLRLAPGWAGIGFGLYSIYPWAPTALYGNTNPLLLLLVLLFATYHVRGEKRAAGIVLGIAVGLKLWPITLLPLLLRERSWSTIGWFVAILGVQIIATTLWLGTAVFPPLVADLTYRLPLGPDGIVIGPAAFDWWPSWASYVLAGLLLLIPARGRLGIGLGILAGMALIPNLWRHYLPTVVAAVLFVIRGLYPPENHIHLAEDSGRAIAPLNDPPRTSIG